MDVQGSQYHLVYGNADWGACTDPTFDATLAELWQEADEGLSALPTAWEYEDELADGLGRVLRLRRETPLFRRAGRTPPLDPSSRRGAGQDAEGGWYWIRADRRGIDRRVPGARQSTGWWAVDDLVASCVCDTPATTGGFTSTCDCGPSDLQLQGLCVTTRDYLLAGYLSPTESGLLVFDLRAGGAPLRMPWPEGFEPWDLVRTDDAGALVLDRTHAAYWRLDEHFRLRGTIPEHAIGFAPVGGGDPIVLTEPARPTPTPVLDEHGQPFHAISIEPGPGGSVLFLESDPGLGWSRLLCYDGAALRWESSLENAVEVVDPADPTSTPRIYDMTGHDIVYLESGGPLQPPLLYVADSEGDQVVAFDLDPETGEVHARDDFLPMRRWASRALVGTERQVCYDFDQQQDTRWVSIEVFTECRFATSAVLRTPLDPAAHPDDVGAPFDSRIPACVWHRLVLDAHVPTGTTLTVRARASDDPASLELCDWVSQPVPYLRSGGSELPYADPWVDWRGDTRRPTPLPDGMGTYELLFQQVEGRHLQVELSITGSGRATPLLRSLRAWFPRFSYVEHYLPAVYAEHDGAGRFLERFLANPEGLLTALEERIEHSHVLLDARTTPTEALPWLAGWFGLVLDPQWDEERRRFLVRHVDRFYRLRGTPGGLLSTLRVYIDGPDERSVFCGGSGAGGLRLVERFLTRDTGGAAYGAPPGAPDPDPAARVRQAAHRFDVLVPVGLSGDAVAMVQRIIEQARPAHTSFQLRRYHELFVVGQARLGLDTELEHGPGDRPSYLPTVPGATALAAGYLGYPFPFDLADRVVSDRDRVGAVPAL